MRFQKNVFFVRKVNFLGRVEVFVWVIGFRKKIEFVIGVQNYTICVFL